MSRELEKDLLRIIDSSPHLGNLSLPESNNLGMELRPRSPTKRQPGRPSLPLPPAPSLSTPKSLRRHPSNPTYSTRSLDKPGAKPNASVPVTLPSFYGSPTSAQYIFFVHHLDRRNRPFAPPLYQKNPEIEGTLASKLLFTPETYELRLREINALMAHCSTSQTLKTLYVASWILLTLTLMALVVAIYGAAAESVELSRIGGYVWAVSLVLLLAVDFGARWLRRRKRNEMKDKMQRWCSSKSTLDDRLGVVWRLQVDLGKVDGLADNFTMDLILGVRDY